jgi:kinetochore protein Spc25, fungi type
MNHVLRPPHVDLSSILTQQNPSIDLRVHFYENSTRNFLKALATYKNRAITNISERRKHQALERKRLLERTQAVEMETNQCKLKEIELMARTLCSLPLCVCQLSQAGLDHEKEERKDGELSAAAFKRQLASLRDQCTSIDVDIEQYQAITQNLRRGTSPGQFEPC